MKLLADYFRELHDGSLAAWNRFWFKPADPATLGLIRILAGGMLFYTHLIWSLDLESFFGQPGWIAPETAARISDRLFVWTYFDWIHSTTGLWAAHIAALIVFGLLTLGLFSRLMAVLAFLIAVSYANRVAPFALFGLDDLNALLAMYLMVGPCGAAYSLDRLWTRRRAGGALPIRPSTAANLAIRLIQVHMCIVYLFSGMGKLTGESWWYGSAIWLSVGNLEYQSLDLTWLANHPLLVNVLTHATVFWELSYCVLVWPRLLRPLVLAMAVAVHLGIAVALGMPTFGLVMIIGNAAFLCRRWSAIFSIAERGRAGEGRPSKRGLPWLGRIDCATAAIEVWRMKLTAERSIRNTALDSSVAPRRFILKPPSVKRFSGKFADPSVFSRSGVRTIAVVGATGAVGRIILAACSKSGIFPSSGSSSWLPSVRRAKPSRSAARSTPSKS